MDLGVQVGRLYSLRVGSKDKGWTITGLNISFDITKNASNKESTNSATIEVYNLSKDKRKFLEEAFITAELYVGYQSYGLVLLFSGEVTEVTTKKDDSNDIVTRFAIGGAYTEINYKTISKLVPSGRTVKDVIDELVREVPSISRSVFTGVNLNSEVLDGYPISTTARKTLDDLSRSYKIDWQIDNGVLFVSDKYGTHGNPNTAILVNKNTGLVGTPYAVEVRPDSNKKKSKKSDNKNQRVSKDGVQFRHLLNPYLVAGGLVKLEDEQFTGLFKVREIRSFGEWNGRDWYSDVILERYSGG